MRIPCPVCGERSSAEFSYLGDAAPKRPASGAGEAAFFDYVYLRDNPPGIIQEWWHHAGGCRSWLIVERNVSTHAIGAVRPAPGVASRTGELAS